MLSSEYEWSSQTDGGREEGRGEGEAGPGRRSEQALAHFPSNTQTRALRRPLTPRYLAAPYENRSGLGRARGDQDEDGELGFLGKAVDGNPTCLPQTPVARIDPVRASAAEKMAMPSRVRIEQNLAGSAPDHWRGQSKLSEG